jgi:hypothetical protein
MIGCSRYQDKYDQAAHDDERLTEYWRWPSFADTNWNMKNRGKLIGQHFAIQIDSQKYQFFVDD